MRVSIACVILLFVTYFALRWAAARQRNLNRTKITYLEPLSDIDPSRPLASDDDTHLT